MFTTLAVLISAAAVGTFIAGLLALLSNPKKSQNRWFFILSVAISAWIPCNFIDSNVVAQVWSGVFLKLDFVAALFIAWALLQFVGAFTVKRSQSLGRLPLQGIRIITLILNLLFTVTIISGLVITSRVHHGSLVVTYQPSFLIYVFLLLGYFVWAFIVLLYKRSYATSAQKSGLNYIAAGLSFAVGGNLLTNLVFPVFISNRILVKELNSIGYLSLFALVLCIYIAITTQKLLDIRPVVTRSLGYILSLAAVGVLFIFSTFTLANTLLDSNVNRTIVKSSYTGVAILLSIVFAPLKRFFDKLTNSFFYRDSYDTQTLLDQFNRVLISTFEINSLLEKTAAVVESFLKPSYAVFIINSTPHTKQLVVGTNNYSTLSNNDIHTIESIAAKSKLKVIAVDALEGHYDLPLVNSKNGLAIIVRLASSVHEDPVGYLLLGAKKSGNLYSAQDKKIIEILANELLIAIQNALRTQEVENFNRTLQDRITEATRKLRRTNDTLHQLDQAKNDFVSMASHQLRTPLTSIKGYTSMVLEGDAGKITPMQRKLLEQSFFSAQRMIYLIADLLNVSRLKTGKFNIDLIPVNLAEVIEQEVGQLTKVAATRSLQLNYHKPDKFPQLLLDENKTRQVVMNFVDNAIYYTPAGGHIDIDLTETATSVQLKVVDNGIGVPKDEQSHLFTKFYRAGNARTARPDGTGLGLFMAKQVIVAEGGTIIFETKEGKGSTFGFTFSKTKHAVA